MDQAPTMQTKKESKQQDRFKRSVKPHLLQNSLAELGRILSTILTALAVGLLGLVLIWAVTKIGETIISSSQHIAHVAEDFLGGTPIASSTTSLPLLFTTEEFTSTSTVVVRATLLNYPRATYRVYWQVDDGDRNELRTEQPIDQPGLAYKEATINLADWDWQADGRYHFRYTAIDQASSTLATRDLLLFHNDDLALPAWQISVDASDPHPSSPASVQPVTTPNPLLGAALYVEPDTAVSRVATDIFTKEPKQAALLHKIAEQPRAIWIGSWLPEPEERVGQVVEQAAALGTIPVLVAYQVPSFSCAELAANPQTVRANYLAWINSFARGIGTRPAVVILEPDALAGRDCLYKQTKSDSLLRQAVLVLTKNPQTLVYIDAGHPTWVSASEMAERLKRSGIEQAAGFSLNVSNFINTATTRTYGEEISILTGGAHFVIDTSRNGNGATANYEWCNPRGRALGPVPQIPTAPGPLDALLWIKQPGESDGTCNGGPAAGSFWLEYALELVRNANG
jgi:endoglucanase